MVPVKGKVLLFGLREAAEQCVNITANRSRVGEPQRAAMANTLSFVSPLNSFSDTPAVSAELGAVILAGVGVKDASCSGRSKWESRQQNQRI